MIQKVCDDHQCGCHLDVNRELFQNVTELRFCEKFNQSVDNLPDNITKIEFGYKFNQLVDNLPVNIREIIFGYDFNQHVDNLPVNITDIQFGHNFNQPVDNLPESIIKIKFGNNFNQPIDNLPINITDIIFGDNFNQPVDNLSRKLNSVYFGDSFKHPINNLTNTIKHFTLSSNSKLHYQIRYLPQFLEKLKISLDNKYDVDESDLVLNEKIKLENLPKTLKKLDISVFDIDIINNLPDNIEDIRIITQDYPFVQINKFPANIKFVQIDYLDEIEWCKIDFINKKINTYWYEISFLNKSQDEFYYQINSLLKEINNKLYYFDDNE